MIGVSWEDILAEHMYAVNITIGSDVFTARFYDNESVRVLIDQMQMTLQMGDYAGIEDTTGLAAALGSGDALVTFSIP